MLYLNTFSLNLAENTFYLHYKEDYVNSC
jgi:hypothetical protein